MMSTYCSRCSDYYGTSYLEHEKVCPWLKGCPWCRQSAATAEHVRNCRIRPATESSYPYSYSYPRYGAGAASTANDSRYFCRKCGISILKDKLEDHLKTHPSQGLPDEIKIIDRRDS